MVIGTQRKKSRSNRAPAGVFPPEAEGGVPYNPTLCNAYEPNQIIVGQGPFWAAPDCSTGLSDCQMNAIAAEILAAVDQLGYAYDSTRVDNLGRALQNLVITGGGGIPDTSSEFEPSVRIRGAWIPLSPIDGGTY